MKQSSKEIINEKVLWKKYMFCICRVISCRRNVPHSSHLNIYQITNLVINHMLLMNLNFVKIDFWFHKSWHWYLWLKYVSGKSCVSKKMPQGTIWFRQYYKYYVLQKAIFSSWYPKSYLVCIFTVCCPANVLSISIRYFDGFHFFKN